MDIISISTHDEDEKSEGHSQNEKIRICLVGDSATCEKTKKAAYELNVPIIFSETGSEYLFDTEWKTYFVLTDFSGDIFNILSKSRQRVLGPPALWHLSDSKDGFPDTIRAIYNYSMKGVITCFTGIRKKDELTKLVNMIHFMGGSIRRDMNSKVTHLICKNSGGEKYQYAMTFRLNVVRTSWVYESWSNRNEYNFNAKSCEFSKMHFLKPFEGYKLCFFGFSPDENEHMVEILQGNGGTFTNLEDPECTHVVVDEHFTQIKPEPKNKKTHIVRSDWFWYTIQNGYANECDFQFGDYLDSIANTSCSDAKDSLPISCNKRKRKILQRKQGDGTPLIVTKRRSSVSDAGLLSVSGSFLDFTSSPDKSKNVIDIECESRLSVASMRFNHFMDYYTTESNYVGILETINTVFKIPLENRADSDDYLLTKSEVKTIFGNFASIHNVHKEMLNRLNEIKMNWKEDLLIGQIILDFRDELLRAYPPYVNYFETMKESLQHCDNQNPRFHAFLKINQAKSECGRQTLQDLMIRPVQRLPSISLLLNDILKYTCKSSPDHKILEEALSALKEVMKFINEDKRKTESQMAIFNIHKEIDGCPPDLISSHRNFIRKCEVTELSDCLSRKGDCLVFYLFSDTIEICKKRSSGGYKHVYLMSLSSIRLIINIADNSRAFSIHCRNGVDSQDFLYSFLINDEENEKIIFLKCLSKQIAENACTMDFEKQMTTMSSHDVGIDIKDANIVAKAFKLVARTRQKVERTFSFNKTPSKLKRAVSTMMTSPFGSTNNLTPSTQLAQMKLASCTNINEVSEDDEKPCLQTKDDLLMAPLSTQPSRRTKTLTLNNLRRI